MKMQYLIGASIAAGAFIITAAVKAPSLMVSEQDVTQGSAQPVQERSPTELAQSPESSGRHAMAKRDPVAPAPEYSKTAASMGDSAPSLPTAKHAKAARGSNPAAKSQPQQSSASGIASSDGEASGIQAYRRVFMAAQPHSADQGALSPLAARPTQAAPGASAPENQSAQSSTANAASTDGNDSAAEDLNGNKRQAKRIEPLFSGPAVQISLGAQISQSTPQSAPQSAPQSGKGAAPLPKYVKASMPVAMNPVAMDAPNIDIDLFGEIATAVRDRVDRRQAGTIIWHGHMQGNPGEFVTIVSRGPAWSATVDYKGRKFELTGAPGHGLVFNEVDVPALPSIEEDGIDGQGQAPFGTPATAPSVSGAPIDQDLLVVYTDDACTGAGGVSGADCSQVEAQIVAAVADMNQSYLASGVDITSNLVGMMEVQYDEDAAYQGEMLDQLRKTNDGIIDEVHTQRDALGADIVSFIVADADGFCGQGYRGSSASYAFSYTMRSCLSNRTQHHEIGHNQGSKHARSQDAGARSGDYNYGYRRCNDGSVDDRGAPYFRTIMAYSCSGAARLGQFANPNINHLGVPSGIDPNVDPDNAAYAARTLNESAAYMAGFRGAPVAPTPPAAPSAAVASAAGTDRIDISWFDNASDETSFVIERSPNGSSWTQITTLGANATSHSDNGLAADTIYYYRLRAANSAGASAYSNVVSEITDPLATTLNEFATGEVAVDARIGGYHSATHRNEGDVQSLTEKRLGDLTIGFEHIWIFNVTGGAGGVVVTAEAWVSGEEGANFYYSTDGGATYKLMFTVDENKSAPVAKLYTLPTGTSGEVMIRVLDASRNRLEFIGTLSVDYLVITSDALSS